MNPFDGMALFARVVEAGSFTRAAAQLGLTKSSASEAVRRLETRLGVRLLERTTRRVRATPAGQAFYARCRRALREAEAADHEARALHAGPVGRLRVAAPPAFARRQLAPVLPQLLDAHPGLQVETVAPAPGADPEDYDLAFLSSRPADDRLTAERLGASQVVVVGAPAYLAERGAPVDPEELGGHRTLGLSPLFAADWRFERAGEGVAIPVRPALVADSVETVHAGALAGAGLALLPRWAVADELAAGSLTQVLVHWRAPESGLYAVYPPNPAVAAMVRRLVEGVAQRLRAQGP